MLSAKRLSSISERIKKYGAVQTDELIKEFGVSAETIRRDLLQLEKENVLKRVYGGAVSSGGTVPQKNLEERMDNFREQKRDLSNTAAEFISEGDIIAIDEGSTAIEFAEVISKKFHKLTVVTYCLDVLNILSSSPGIDIILCGGRFNSEENAFFGELTATALSNLHVMKAFISPSAISLDGGIMDINDDFTRIQKKIIDISDEIFILADSSKFEKKALMTLCGLNTEYRYITDRGLSGVIYDMYKENGINIIRSK